LAVLAAAAILEQDVEPSSHHKSLKPKLSLSVKQAFADIRTSMYDEYFSCCLFTSSA
jgi:hypothetical protein